MLIRFLVCLAVAASRLLELAYSRRNIGEVGPTEEGEWSRRTYPLMVALHATAIGATLLFGGKAKWHWLLLLAAVQPVRAWVLLTLGARWNTRGAVASQMDIATGGPYAYVRHPNYAVVAVELLALPLAFGLRRTAAAVAIANAMLLAVRIREEESLLGARPRYEEHFARKARFIPKVF